jgi:uncharacterized protein
LANDRTLKLAGLFGAWGVALQGIQKALARNGIQSEFLSTESSAAFMGRMDQLEAAMDRGEKPVAKFDEAGMLFVDQGAADIGVNFREQVDWAYRGFIHHEPQPHRNLRGLARLVQPQYTGFAVTQESGITSLEQIAKEQRPIRLFTVSRSKHQTRFMGYVHSRVLEESGFTQADVVKWGGRVFTAEDGLQAILENNLDLMALPAYSNWGPAWGLMWMHAQIRMNLRFLPVAESVRDGLAKELNLRKGTLPAYLFRGVDQGVPTFAMKDHTVCTHADLCEQDAYNIVKAIDEHPDCLQEGPVPFAYHPYSAWQDLSLPLHPGAEAYYRERGYLTGSVEVAQAATV